MALQPREIPEVQEIARQIAKEEIEVTGKRPKELANKLESVITDLETKITDLAMKVKELEKANTIDLAEIKKAVQAALTQKETPKLAKRGYSNDI